LTGNVLEQKATSTVVKKLKLVGHPYKIFKNTAFVSGMFNSALEVSKFEHAKIKTVSGIRGSIKKALKEGEPGSFRATFEDKVLMSDLVVCRLWVPVELKDYYNPVHSLLAAFPAPGSSSSSSSASAEQAADAGASSAMPLMRTTAAIRREEQVPQVVNGDSVYKPIVRVPRQFGKMRIPAKVQASLPFASKPKNQAQSNKQSYLSRRAVVLDPEEKKGRAAVQMLSSIRADKLDKRAASAAVRTSKKAKEKKQEAGRFEERNQEEKKRKYKEAGKEQASREKKKSRG
jgi:ribosome biogenesis protein BMS1